MLVELGLALRHRKGWRGAVFFQITPTEVVSVLDYRDGFGHTDLEERTRGGVKLAALDVVQLPRKADCASEIVRL